MGPNQRTVWWYVYSLAVSGVSLFAGTFGSGVFLSTNNGTSWTAASTGLTNTNVLALAVSGTNLFAGTQAGGAFRSTDNGDHWTAANSGLNTAYAGAFGISGTNLFLGTDNSVFVSTDNGGSWSLRNVGLPDWGYSYAFAFLGFYSFASKGDYVVYRSTDNGLNWSPASAGLPTTDPVWALAASGIYLFAGTGGRGVFLSSDSGSTWHSANAGMGNVLISQFAVIGANILAGTLASGVLLSTNNGANWTAVNTGLTSTRVSALSVVGTNLFAGTNGGVWRRPLSEMLTSVQRTSSDLPTHFNLEQNYPNPFNPATTISFSVPSKSLVSLKVFDALGREVSTLLADELSAGTYARQWHAGALPSGVYFYRLLAGSFTETKRLLLLK
jgi:photosystem II stability/assembly factor-like uncharacterized protein